jgi:hypothetical protein
MRMFRSRLSAWGQDKNSKMHEMQALAIEAYRHRSAGRRVIFIVRGKEVTYETVQRYFKRRGTSIEAVAVKSPARSESHVELVESDQLSSPAISPIDEVSARTPPAQDVQRSSPAAPVPKQIHPVQPLSSALAPTLTTPSTLAAPEKALYAINAYIHGSFDAGSWLSTSDSEHFKVAREKRVSACVLYDHMNKLHCQVRLACDLFQKNRFREGGYFLRSSMDGIREMAESAYPPLPMFLPQTLLSVLRRGTVEVASAIIYQFAAFSKCYHGDRHPIYRICQFLGSIEPHLLLDAVYTIITAVSAALSAALGPLHRTTLGARYGALGAAMWAHTGTFEPAAVARGVRQIVQECQAELPSGDVRTVVFQLYLARWLLKTPSLSRNRAEAEQIINVVRGQWMFHCYDKEAAVLLAQVQIDAAGRDVWSRRHAIRLPLQIANCCPASSCADHRKCVVKKLYWPSMDLWEWKAALLGESDSTLIRHVRET